MDIVNVGKAKAQLSKLVDQAAAGHDVIIARRGKPIARLTRLATEKPPLRFGLLAGRVRIEVDGDADLTDGVLVEFEG
jgi:prevent-host-death family protein